MKELKRTMVTLSVLFLSLLLIAPVMAQDVYVKSFKGIIKDANKDKILTTVPRGTKLKKIGADGLWAKVEHQGKIGYISNMYIDNQPPTEAIQFGNLKNPNVIARRRASAEVTAASARGAASESEMVALRGGKLKNGKIDMAPVLNMEKYAIADQDLEKFLQEGNVNPR